MIQNGILLIKITYMLYIIVEICLVIRMSHPVNLVQYLEFVLIMLTFILHS